jgi:two-component system response regulator NreC
MSVTTLVLADDHHIVRQGLRALLEAEPDFSILGEAADGLEVAGVVILSMHSNEAYVLEALRNGVAGYVLKESTASDLAQAVREAAAGRRYLSPPLSERANLMRKLGLRSQTDLIRYAFKRGLVPMEE